MLAEAEAELDDERRGRAPTEESRATTVPTPSREPTATDRTRT